MWLRLGLLRALELAVGRIWEGKVAELPLPRPTVGSLPVLALSSEAALSISKRLRSVGLLLELKRWLGDADSLGEPLRRGFLADAVEPGERASATPELSVWCRRPLSELVVALERLSEFSVGRM